MERKKNQKKGKWEKVLCANQLIFLFKIEKEKKKITKEWEMGEGYLC